MPSRWRKPYHQQGTAKNRRLPHPPGRDSRPPYLLVEQLASEIGSEEKDVWRSDGGGMVAAQVSSVAESGSVNNDFQTIALLRGTGG